MQTQSCATESQALVTATQEMVHIIEEVDDPSTKKELASLRAEILALRSTVQAEKVAREQNSKAVMGLRGEIAKMGNAVNLAVQKAVEEKSASLQLSTLGPAVQSTSIP